MRTWPLLVLIILVVGACVAPRSDLGREADSLKERGEVPQKVKSDAPELLSRCHVSSKGRVVWFNWEALPGSPKYTLELTKEQFESSIIKQCLTTTATALGVQNEIDWSYAEAPPPPPEDSATRLK